MSPLQWMGEGVLTDEIEILERPDGKFTWCVNTGRDLRYASSANHATANDAEKAARRYVATNLRNIVFVVVRRKRATSIG